MKPDVLRSKGVSPRNQGLLVGLGGLFAAGFVHSLLSPTWELWLRVMVTAGTSLVVSGTLAFVLLRLRKL